jgi:hypothetical protein
MRPSAAFGSFALLLTLFAGSASAEEVCVAREGVVLLPANGGAAGALERGFCYAVQDRFEGATRVWIPGPQGFVGDADIPNDALAWTLVDDVELRSGPRGDVFGGALSGGVVSIVERRDGGAVVTPVEGRLRPRFWVPDAALFPSPRWLVPDPEDAADSGWPQADRPLPPAPAELAQTPGGAAVVSVGPPLLTLRDHALDPAFGALRWTELERTEFEVHVQIVASTLWVKGWTSALDWREPEPEGGWPMARGVSVPPVARVGARQVGSKEAELSREPKSEPFGKLGPGTRVDVGAEEKGRLKVTAHWAGGQASGWIDKRRLLKEGQEDAVAPELPRLTLVSVGQTAVTWVDGAGHSEEGAEHPIELVPEPGTRVVRGAGDALRRLYFRALQADPAAAGEVTVRLRVLLDGTIEEAAVVKDTLGRSEITDTLVALLQPLVFPERAAPRKKRSDPELDWRNDVWVQVLFAPLPG